MKRITVDPTNVTQQELAEAGRAILEGKIVAFPTETVYGLAARSDKKEVVDTLYAIKARECSKPFSFAVSDPDRARDYYFAPMTPFGNRLIEKGWPGPLTIVYYSPDGKKIGVRVPSHPVAQEILRQVMVGVYLPSANISGKKEALTADEVQAAFDGKIDVLVDGGTCLYGQPSTVIDLTSRPFKILREGAIPIQQIVQIFIQKRLVFVCTGNTCRSPMAEFLLKKYLAQTKPYLYNRYEIISRGIFSVVGSAAASLVSKILKEEEGMATKGFVSQQLTKETLLSADLIFTMEDRQVEHILHIEPSVEGRIFNIKKFLPPEIEEDIPDPVGKSAAFYQEVYGRLRQAIIELTDWL